MKDRKRRIESFSFFNQEGISRHLEKMAAKGWMLERMTNFGWVYHRIEPKKVHFTVSYYPKASAFDPEPTEGEKTFQEFCEHTGWELVCTSAQMQIFYNEKEEPIPIQTEVSLEIESIHASAKKSFIPAYLLLLVVAFLQTGMFVSTLFSDPIELLSSPTRLFTGFCALILVLLCLVELVVYFFWYAKAGKAVEQGGYIKASDTSKFQKYLLVAIVIGAIYWIINFVFCGEDLERIVTILICIYIPGLIYIVNAVKTFLKRRKVSKGINRTVTIMCSFLFAFVIVGAISFGTIWAYSNRFFVAKDEETYEYNGITWIAQQDELPLVIEDMMETDYDEYIKARTGDESLFLGKYEMSQTPRYGAENYSDIPYIEYTIIDIKVPFLYNTCKERMIYEEENLYKELGHIYKRVDAEPWGAKEVYRMYYEEESESNQYLVCYDNVLLEIQFGFEVTEQQMRIVGEQLGI